MNAAARLTADQQTLLRAVLGGRDDDALWALLLSKAPSVPNEADQALARRGLLAYQSHGLALAERALGAAYPVVAQLMGDENFAALAPHFWRQQPPACGDVARWGDGLANFLAAAPQLADEPFLTDLARVEWALHCASIAADGVPDLASFALLSAEPPAAPSLKLSPGVWLLKSHFPVVSLIHAHLLPAADRPAALADVAALLKLGTGENALVWREGFKARVRHITATEHALLAALLADETLEAGLTKAGCAETRNSEPAFDFTEWLAHSVKSGLVTGAFLKHNCINNNKEASE